jgi:hypothetical protein
MLPRSSKREGRCSYPIQLSDIQLDIVQDFPIHPEFADSSQASSLLSCMKRLRRHLCHLVGRVVLILIAPELVSNSNYVYYTMMKIARALSRVWRIRECFHSISWYSVMGW